MIGSVNFCQCEGGWGPQNVIILEWASMRWARSCGMRIQLVKCNIMQTTYPRKLLKKRHRLKVRSNSFSLRVIDSWNALPESVVMAPSLNCFKSRLNLHWKNHPYKFDPWCYIPGPKPRDYYHNAPTEAVLSCSGVPVM